MRMDSAETLTAADVVNGYSEAELAALIARNGEERYARRIAARIVAARPLRNTGDLVEAIKAGIPAPARRRGGHPARRTFQAIRIEVNHELPNLAAGLDESVHLLAPEGRMLVLAYHSLEDREVKRRFTDWSRTEEPEPVPKELPRRSRIPLVRLLTRRPLRPTERRDRREPACRQRAAAGHRASPVTQAVPAARGAYPALSRWWCTSGTGATGPRVTPRASPRDLHAVRPGRRVRRARRPSSRSSARSCST